MRKFLVAILFIFVSVAVAVGGSWYDKVGKNTLIFFAQFYEGSVYTKESVQYEECSQLSKFMLEKSGIQNMGFVEIFVIAANFSGQEEYAGNLLGRALVMDGYEFQEADSDGRTTDMVMFVNQEKKTIAAIYAFNSSSVFMPSARSGDICFTVYGLP